MDPSITVAVVGAAAAVIGGVVTSPLVVHALSRRLRTAQAEQVATQTDLLRQDIYQQITADLRDELARVNTALADARESLRITSGEAERLRIRVVELESRLAQLSNVEGELRIVQADRDQARTQLAARDATIAALRQQIGDLRTQVASLQVTPST